MSLADVLRSEGMEEGEKKGRKEGESRVEAAWRETLLSGLRTRFGELPADVVARVEQATQPQLSKWSLAAMQAATLEAVFAD